MELWYEIYLGTIRFDTTMGIMVILVERKKGKRDKINTTLLQMDKIHR